MVFSGERVGRSQGQGSDTAADTQWRGWHHRVPAQQSHLKNLNCRLAGFENTANSEAARKRGEADLRARVRENVIEIPNTNTDSTSNRHISLFQQAAKALRARA
jgi:hypothetical protein